MNCLMVNIYFSSRLRFRRSLEGEAARLESSNRDAINETIQKIYSNTSQGTLEESKEELLGA